MSPISDERYTWLREDNPMINLVNGTVTLNQCPISCRALKASYGNCMEETEKDHLRQIHKNKEPSKGIEPEEAFKLVPLEYHEFLDIFSKKASERTPKTQPWDHAVDLKPDFVPKKGQLIPLSMTEQHKVKGFVEDQLAKGYIRPSKSLQTSPVFFISKKDGKKCIVIDYRYLNEGTVKNNYPLPLISQIVDKLKGSKIFIKMDLRWGYNNMRIKKEDEWKGAFVCHLGSFEPTVMYFGMYNSPATFQQMMNEICADMTDVVIIYIDDLLIFTNGDMKHHQEMSSPWYSTQLR
jgi:hypothetical protein